MASSRSDLRSAILAGVAATLTLTALMYLAPFAGFPNIDMASVIGGFLGQPAVTFTFRWWIGLAIFVAVGSVASPLLFVRALPWLYGGSWVRGLEWGFLLWVVGGIWAMTYLGLAFHEPFTVQPQLASLSSFLGNLAYGAVLGGAVAQLVRHKAG
jgi:hypothetical protein